MKKSNDDERGDLVTAHLLVSVSHSASLLLIFPKPLGARTQPNEKDQDGAPCGIASRPIGESSDIIPPCRRTGPPTSGARSPAAAFDGHCYAFARSGPSFNAEAMGAQLLYRFTSDSP
jgi:hypothetical protein